MAQACAPDGNNFCLTGVGNGNNLDGIYVSPYTAVVNGVTTSVICDDFSDDVQIGENWTATAYSVTSAATSGLFAGSTTTNPVLGYEEVAWLSQQLLSGPQTSYQQDLLSYSIWAVFEPTAVDSWLSAPTSSPSLSWSAVQTEVSAAASAAPSGNYSDVTVYTPVNGTESCCGRPQEFVVVHTAEAPAAASLAVEFLGLGALLFLFRRFRFAAR